VAFQFASNHSDLALDILEFNHGNFEEKILSKKLSLLSCFLNVSQTFILPFPSTLKPGFFIRQAGTLCINIIFS
jgi:hypothetical protein